MLPNAQHSRALELLPGNEYFLKIHIGDTQALTDICTSLNSFSFFCFPTHYALLFFFSSQLAPHPLFFFFFLFLRTPITSHLFGYILGLFVIKHTINNESPCQPP